MPTRVESKEKTAKKQSDTNESNPEAIARAWQEEDRENIETLEFIQAIDRYKRRTQKAFPAWSEVLQVLKSLGYRKAKK